MRVEDLVVDRNHIRNCSRVAVADALTTADIQALAAPVLRHRILLSYRAEAEGITVEKVIEQVLEHVRPPVT